MEIKPSPSRDIRYVVAAAFCLVFLLLTRFANLSAKPYHHDESLYATESWRYATQGLYKFNPMLHGPFLFHAQAALFKILPINDFTGRLPIALAGTGLALFAFAFAARTGWLSAVVWLSLIAFSPVFCFFSRFLGMDVLLTFLATGFLVCAMKAWERRSPPYLYLASIFLISMVCTKLNWLFYVFSFGTFFLAAPLWDPDGYRPAVRAGVESVKDFANGFGRHWLWIGGIVTAIFVSLNSSLFTNMGGVLDALGRTMIPYWINQHKIERVGGPFHYYFPMLAVYELPLLLGILFSVLHILRSSKKLRKSFISWVIACVVLYGFLAVSWSSLGPTLSTTLHLKEPFHLPLLLLEIALWLLLMRYHLRAGETFAAFAAHWGVTSLILYSLAGEKVPWLTTHVILPWFFYFALVLPSLAAGWMTRSFSRVSLGVALIVVLSWQAVVTVRASFPLASDPHEMLVYTHTTPETVELVQQIKRMADFTGEKLNFAAQVTGNGVWPLQWYLRDFKRWYWPKIDPAANPKVVVDDWEKREEIAKLLGPGFEMERFKLRAWWVPDTHNATWIDYIKYYFFREIFSPTGSTDLVVFIHNGIIAEWRRVSLPPVTAGPVPNTPG